MIHQRRTTCRGCGSDCLRQFLALGPTPLANSFLTSEEEFSGEASFPLDVYFCENCSLVQLLDVIDPEVLFRNYIYVTGTSDTIAAHNRRYAQQAVDFLGLSEGDLVIEIASNDGSLLKCFQEHRVRTLGVEPAVNIAAMARANGIETFNEFFNAETAGVIRDQYGPARAVIGNNVLAHVDEVQDFLLGCRRLLAEDGCVMIEVPGLGELVRRLEYDTVYHEHLSYFSVGALRHLFEAVGLSIVKVDDVDVHGGSLRVYAGLPEHYGGHGAAVLDRIQEEQRLGLYDFARFEKLNCDVQKNREALVDLLASLKQQGLTVAGYGAPAKGNTLLNYCGITPELLPYTVDKNPLKVGMYTPGAHIPVLHVSALLKRRPDYVLILAWNFADEIMRQQQAYRDLGGKFIIPIPEPLIVE